jgi:hypothetical protein
MTSAEIEARDVENIRLATERRIAHPNATPGAEVFSRHVHVTDCLRGGKVSSCCSCHHCTLAVCSVCGAYEGGLTTHCPGGPVDYDTTLAVYRTDLDFTTPLGWHLSGVNMGLRSPVFDAEPAA